MKTTVRIALLLTLTIATACRFVAEKKDDAVRFLAATVLGSVAELQSATPLEQSSFRDAEPVAPKKEKAAAPAIRAERPVSFRAEARNPEAPRRVRDEIPRELGMTPCHRVQEIVVPMPDTIDG